MIDIIVIGAGAAGMTAALYALRNGKKVTIIEKNGIGGQIAESPRVENFPTIVSISGSELADKMFEQITRLGVEFKFGEVISVKKQADGSFVVKTEFDELSAKSVIIAGGVEHRKLNLEHEEELIGHGISYCALCDGAFYTGEDIVLIGDGNTALQYALLLSSTAKTVHVITLFDKFFGDKNLVDALNKKSNVQVTHNSKLVKLVGESELNGLVFERADKSTFIVNTKALFVAIGQVPNNKVYGELVELTRDGYIVAGSKMETKTPGLFVAGDCREKDVRQLTTACADGAVAATSASTYVETLAESFRE